MFLFTYTVILETAASLDFRELYKCIIIINCLSSHDNDEDGGGGSDDDGDVVFCHLLSAKDIAQARNVRVVWQILIGYCWQHWYCSMQAERPNSTSKSS